MPQPFDRPWVAVQRNPRSGAGRQQRVLLDFVAKMRQAGVRARLYTDRGELDAAVADPLRRRTLLAAIAAGGDGTILDLLRRHVDLPIGFIPLGTENLIARWLGVPRNGTIAAEIVLKGRKQRFDLCSVATPTAPATDFAIMLSIGFDADVIHRIHANRQGHIRRWDYVPVILSSLRQQRYPEFRLYLDERPEPVKATLAVIANLPAYAMGLPVVPTANGQDGWLDIRCFHPRDTLSMLKCAVDIRFGRHEQMASIGKFRAQRVRIESDEPIPMQTDGDPAGQTPAEINIRPLVAEWIVP